MLVCNRDGDLRLDLEKLVLHIENDLLDHLFRVFSLVDQVVEVCPDQCCDSFQKCHTVLLQKCCRESPQASACGNLFLSCCICPLVIRLRCFISDQSHLREQILERH